jgi:hypothetical protein
MSKKTEHLHELRSLLFGSEPYHREDAPEPEFLRKLAAQIPDALLPGIFEALLYISIFSARERRQLLSELATRVDHATWKRLLPEVVDHFPEILPHLSESVLDEVRSTAPLDTEAYQNLILEAIARSINTDDWETAVAPLLPLLSETDPDAVIKKLQKQVNERDAFPIRQARWLIALLSLRIPLLTKAEIEAMVHEIFTLADTASSERDRAQIYAILAPLVPENSHAYIFSQAKTMQDPINRLSLFSTLLPLSTEPLSSLISGETLNAIHSVAIEDSTTVTNIVASIPHLPRKDQIEVLQRLLNAIPALQWDNEKAHALREVTRHLPETLIPSAFAIAQNIRNKWWRERSIASMYPYLSKDEQDTISDDLIDFPYRRIITLLNELSDEDRHHNRCARQLPHPRNLKNPLSTPPLHPFNTQRKQLIKLDR